MTHSEYFSRVHYDLFDEMVVYDYFQKMGLTGQKRSFKDWARSAEWALYYFRNDNA